MKMSPPSPAKPSVLLGLFILAQIVFMLSYNLLGLANDLKAEVGQDIKPVVQRLAPGWLEEKSHLGQWIDTVQQGNKAWAQTTGQLQSWSLFAPWASEDGAFPALLLSWEEDADAPRRQGAALAPLAASNPWETLVAQRLSAETLEPKAAPPGSMLIFSDNEPKDRNRYVRLGHFRLRRFENNILPTLRDEPQESEEENKNRFRRKIQELVEEYGPHVFGYVQWRYHQVKERFKDRPPPRQVILVLRRYQIFPPEQGPPYWKSLPDVPLFRWQPQAVWDNEHSPYEWYDPTTERFRRQRP